MSHLQTLSLSQQAQQGSPLVEAEACFDERAIVYVARSFLCLNLLKSFETLAAKIRAANHLHIVLIRQQVAVQKYQALALEKIKEWEAQMKTSSEIVAAKKWAAGAHKRENEDESTVANHQGCKLFE
jgi:hypothetical protein